MQDMPFLKMFDVFPGDDVDLLIQVGYDFDKFPELSLLVGIKPGKVFSDQFHGLWFLHRSAKNIQKQLPCPE